MELDASSERGLPADLEAISICSRLYERVNDLSSVEASNATFAARILSEDVKIYEERLDEMLGHLLQHMSVQKLISLPRERFPSERPGFFDTWKCYVEIIAYSQAWAEIRENRNRAADHPVQAATTNIRKMQNPFAGNFQANL